MTNPTPPKPPADAPLGICPQCGKANSWTENDKYRHSLLCRPADALPDVKAICARLEHARKAFKFDGIVIWDSTLTEAITALERLAGEAGHQRQIIEVYEGTTRKLAQLETELRSSEAALATLNHDWKGKCFEADTMRQHFKVAEELLAEARQLTSVLSADLQDAQERLAAEEADHFYEEDKLTAELTALRANAGEDSRLLEWLETSRAEIDTDGPGYIIYTPHNGLGYGASKGSWPTLRQAIRAAMSATPPQAPLTSGGEK